jgi:DNA-directed RNA polymerase subunit M/transcription elongation factor TFIIS
MSFCVKCNTHTNLIIENNVLYSVCKICQYKSEEKNNKIYSEIINNDLQDTTNINVNVIYNKIYPLCEKNNEIYTIVIEPGTICKKKYICHSTKKIYDKI